MNRINNGNARVVDDVSPNIRAVSVRTQEFISKFSVPFTQAYDFDELINQALFELRNFTGTDRAIILEFQSDNTLLCTHENVISEKTPKVLGLSLAYQDIKPLLDEAEQTGCFYEKEATRYFEKYPATDLGEKSFCYIPLTIGGNRAGYLVFFTMFEQANWAEGEFRLATMAGSIIAGAYSRKMSEEAMLETKEAELRTQEFISRFSVPFTQPYEFDELINNALFELRDFTKTDRAIILEFQSDDSLLCTHEDVINEETPKVRGHSLSYKGVRLLLDEAERTGCFYEKEAARYFEKHPAADLGEKSFCYIPLTIGGNRAGYLVFFTMFEEANWAEGEFRLATMAGSIIAGAYSRKLSEEALLATKEFELRTQEFISRFSVPFTQPYEFDELINNALFELRDFTKTDRAIILEFQSDDLLLCTHEDVINEETPKVLGHSLSYKGVRLLLDEAERTGCFYEKEAVRYFEKYPAADLGEKSFCYIPLTIGGNRAGYLVFFTMFEEANWAEGEFRLATMAGSIIAGAYSRKLSEEAILTAKEAELRTQEFITRFSVPFTQPYDFDELINNALFELRDFTKTDRALILEFQSEGILLCTHESIINEETPKVLGRSLPYLGVKLLLDEAERTGCFYEKEAKRYFQSNRLMNLGEKSFCCIPLTIGGNRAGYLVFNTMFEEANWAEGEFRLATMAGSIIAGAYSRKLSEDAMLTAKEAELRTQEFITRFSVPFTQPYEFDELINNALYALRDFTKTDRAIILEFQPDGSLLCTHEDVINEKTPKVIGRSLTYKGVKSLLDEAEQTGCFYEKEAASYFKKYPEADLGEKSFCYIPLTIGGNRAGYLVFFTMFEEANWAEGEFQLATMAGSIIAGAYSRKLSEDAMLTAKEAELRTQEFITRFSVPFTQPYEFDELINNALYALRDFTKTDRAIILEFQHDESLLCIHEDVINEETPKVLGHSLSYKGVKSLLDEAERTGCFYEKEAASYFKKYPEADLGEKSFCYIPLTIGGNRAGYLVFFTMFEEANWAEGEFRLATMAGSIIAGAYSRKLSEEAMLATKEAELRTQEFISRFSVPFTQPYEFDELINNALFELRDFTKTDRAIILEFQPDGSLLCTHENVISKETPNVLGRSLSYEDIRPVLDEAEKSGCFYEKEAASYFEKHPATDLGEKSFCYIPLMIEGERAGYLVFFTMFEQANWAEDEFRLVTMTGSIITGAFATRKNDELREAAAKAQQESEAKSNFLSVMSHEIRTPMNSIMGFAELAKNGHDLTPQLDNYLSKIMDNTQWLLRIINDVLDISKIESGKMELEYVPFGLHEVISRCHSVVLPEVNDKGLDMRVYAEPLPGKKLMGDPVRLYQALLNLFSNAIKFTQTGFIRLSALVRSADENNAVIYFEVKDTGIGLSAEQIAKIFEPFMQADSSTTRTYGGTGLGLSITKNIVELMGGRLMVESELEVGSLFSFEITFDTVDDASADVRRIKLDEVERPYFEGLVLVCDDNLMNQQVMCGHLESIGLRTVVADNGKEAVDRVLERIAGRQEPFDLILMDIFMPVLDGIEAARQITKLNTGTPIVAVTANIMTGEIEKYKKHGMPEYLGKPFTSQELWRTLLKFLTPVSSSVLDKDADERSRNEMLRALQVNFVMNNQTKYDEIIEALDTGDTDFAHRLVHTLKGNAGFIGKPELQNIAARVEVQIQKGNLPIAGEKLAVLEKELKMVLEELNPLMLEELAARETKQELTPEQIAALFQTLEVLLEDRNPESMNHLAEIRAVPGASEFARYVEHFDFESAIQELDRLKGKFKGLP